MSQRSSMKIKNKIKTETPVLQRTKQLSSTNSPKQKIEQISTPKMYPRTRQNLDHHLMGNKATLQPGKKVKTRPSVKRPNSTRKHHPYSVTNRLGGAAARPRARASQSLQTWRCTLCRALRAAPAPVWCNNRRKGAREASATATGTLRKCHTTRERDTLNSSEIYDGIGNEIGVISFWSEGLGLICRIGGLLL